jgi:hypothetical protein
MPPKTAFTYIGFSALPLVLSAALYHSQCQLHDGGACAPTAPHDYHHEPADTGTVTLRLLTGLTVQAPPAEPLPVGTASAIAAAMQPPVSRPQMQTPDVFSNTALLDARRTTLAG